MKLLALDASTTAIGWALFDLERDHPDDLLEYGIKRFRGPLWDRIVEAEPWVQRRLLAPVLVSTPPDLMGALAIETPVIYMIKGKPRNAQSVIKQAYMVGALVLLARGRGLRVLEIRPDERLTAIGLPARLRNPKPWVVRNVNAIYSLDLGPKEHDVADAIAIGWAARRKLMLEEVSRET